MAFRTLPSNSPYDHEAVLPNIESCDGTTIVKDVRGDHEGMVYDKYIRHISDVHQKLFTILKDDHSAPNFKPERAFPNVIDEDGVFVAQWIYVVLGSIVVVIGIVMALWSKLEVLKYAVVEENGETAERSSADRSITAGTSTAIEQRPLLS